MRTLQLTHDEIAVILRALGIAECELPTHARGDGLGFKGHRLT